MLKFPINQAGQLLSKAALGIQAMHRISHFMERESNDTENKNLGSSDDNTVLKVEKGTFFVGSSISPNCKEISGDAAFTLSGINVKVKRGEVLAVVGPVASGKSTLIQGLLGDIEISDETIITMTDGATLSYAAQTPFILSTTVRENILFGLPFDIERYEKVLDACCLRPDLSQWPAGDLTQIGERGVTMSGGQKQRVSIARSVYANSDIGLFDDILSALDAGTSEMLFQNLFGSVHDKNGLLHESGVLLVTHAQHLLQRVDKIVVLHDGQMIFYGNWEELQSFKSNDARHSTTLTSMQSSLQLRVVNETPKTAKSKKASTNTAIISKDADAHKGELITAEQRDHGVSKIGIWVLWFHSVQMNKIYLANCYHDSLSI